ncbi:MAG: hypothetical protein ABR549_04655 [Mycobacteriales bacterium]
MRRLVGAATLCVALSACGSTAQLSSTSEIGDGLGSGPTDSSLGGTSGSATSGGSGSITTGGYGGSGSTTAGGGAGTTGTGGSAAGGPSSAPLPTQAAQGLGVTDKTISIGFGYSTDNEAANAAIGGSAFTTGDGKANGKALIDEINAHGGVAGRKLVPVFHAYNITSPSSGASQDEQACQDWTRDHKVMAVISSNLTDTLVACLKQKGVIYFRGGAIVDTDQTYLRTYSNEVLTGTMTLDRIFRDQVQALVRKRWFTGWNTLQGTPGTMPVKVGVLTYDTDSFTRTLRGVLLPALAAAGHAPAEVDVLQVHKVQQQSDTAATSAQIKSAVLRLQQDRVTHVVLGDTSGLLLEFFGSNARSQSYYPRLGVNSGAAVQAIYDAGLVDDQQVNGVVGNGWLPTIDLPASDANQLANSETRRCLEIMKRRTGQTYTSVNAATIALGDCDGMFLFQRAIGLATSLTPAGLLAGVERLGDSFVSPLLGPTYLSPRQHDTAVRAWDTTWVGSCTCIKYSVERRVPPA